MNPFADVMLQANKLWLVQRHAEALRRLEEGIKRLPGKTDVTWLRLQACLIAKDLKDLPLVRRYCQDVLSSEPDNVLALYNLADVALLEGEHGLSLRCAKRAYSIVSQSRSEEDLALAGLLRQRWPEIAA